MEKDYAKVGGILLIFIGVIVGLILFQAIAGGISQSTGTTGPVTVVNGTYTGILNTNVELAGGSLVSLTSVSNATTGATIAAANYTVGTCVRTTDGLKGICYKATGVGNPAATGPVKISYVYYPDGYIEDGGARAVANLILILVALGIMGFVLYPIIKDNFGGFS